MKNRSELINEHILQHLGPQQALPLSWLIILTIVYILILICGLIGNIITILVIFRFRYMQSITNLYLCNLAITDLISLMFSLPLELYTLWHQYPWQLGTIMCSLKTLILEGTANASVLTLVTFTVERYLAICGSSKNIPPSTQTLFNGKSISKIKRIACRNIALIWTISLCGATPLVLLTRINYLDYDSIPLEQSAWCGLAYNEPDKRWELVMLSSTVVFFLIPLMIISCLYYQIARKLKKAIRLDNFNQSDIQLTDHATSRKIIQSRRIVIRMLVVIVIAFTFCWSPFHAQRLLFLYVTLYSSWNIVTRQINGILFLSAGCLYYLNSSLNPLIYSLLSTRFRAAFMLYVNGCCGQGHSNSGNGNGGAGIIGVGGPVGPSTSGQPSQEQQQRQQQQLQQTQLQRPRLNPLGMDNNNKKSNTNNNSNNSVILINGNHFNHNHHNKNLIVQQPKLNSAKVKWKSNTNHNHNHQQQQFNNKNNIKVPGANNSNSSSSKTYLNISDCHHHPYRQHHQHYYSHNNCFGGTINNLNEQQSIDSTKAMQNSW